MKISNKLPQFEHYYALFIASGEYEALFYLAGNGHIELIESIKKPPREEAKEKQAFVGKKSGMFSLVAVSHKGNYIEDLKMKFVRAVHEKIRFIMSSNTAIESIYLFAPRYAHARIMNELNPNEKAKIRMSFFGEFTKQSPIYLVEAFFEENEKIKQTPIIIRDNSSLISINTEIGSAR